MARNTISSRLIGRAALAVLGLNVLAANFSGCISRERPSADATPRNGFHPYGFDHATLHFTYGGMMRGEETMWIDSGGTMEARHINAEQIDVKGFRPVVSLAIRHGSDMTIIDSAMRKGFHFVDPLWDSLYRLPATGVPTPQHQFESVFRDLKYHKVGDSTMAGLPTEIWEQEGSGLRLYEWRGLVVGRSSSRASGTALILQSIDTVSRPDASHFVVPGGIPIANQPPAGAQ